jgi:co-chaperonin GroES (HSP10)
MTTLLVPDHVLRQQQAKKKAEEEASKKPITERIPQPTGWRILVMPYQGKAKTEGGVYVPDQENGREKRATVVAYVVKVGPLAYLDEDKFGEGFEPWCKEGDWVCIGRYAGSRFQIEGGEVRIINDDEVIATIIDPDDIKTYGA